MVHASVRRRDFTIAAAAGLVSGLADAQAWPSRPITLVVGSAAGGGTDDYARAVAPLLTTRLGQTVVVENVAGASGVLGAQKVMRATPDGYTLLFANTDLVLGPIVHKAPGYSIKDVTPIGLVGFSPLILVGHPSLPLSDVDQLVALAKAKPGSVTVGVAGVASLPAVATHMLVKATGIDIVRIPYKGAAQAVTDLLAGEVKVVITALTNVVQHVQSGRLKALGMLSPKRSAMLPDTPSLSESVSIKGLHVDIWAGLVGPAGLPMDIVSVLSRHLQDVVKDPAFRESRRTKGDTLASPASPAEVARFLAAEDARYRAVMSGMKFE